MINRYGSWMDTNIVQPAGPESCTVRFDWWLEGKLGDSEALIEQSIAESEQVSMQPACPLYWAHVCAGPGLLR